ncbi:MAG: DUF4340 domain-containing protein [Balneolaceae bacterium]|nr:DUF4340 domain-containing protein [Balneolaceae bacterium]
MTNATKSLTIIFVSLLAITAMVKWIGNPSSSEAFRTQLIEVDTTRVDKIVVETPTEDRRITLRKTDNGWQVTGNSDGESYPADAASVERAMEQLHGLNVQAVATRDPEKHTRFKVDSTGTKVGLYDGEAELAAIMIGAPQIVSRREFNSYVRPAGENAVYTVEGFLGSIFGRDVDGWRNKVVWDLEQDKISRIDFQFPADSSYSITKAGENAWVSGSDTLQAGSLSTITRRLGTLRASGFVDSLSVEQFGSELYAIRLQLDNGVRKELRLKPAGDDATVFQAAATDYPYLFTLNKSTFENAVLKGRSELLGDR